MKISWFGRCCFLIETENKRVLFDPYDTYCKVDIGIIPVDVVISSSTWHDHGHIGASPKAYICTYPGKDNGSGLEIQGIETKEERGTSNVIFNLKIGLFSITNFADFGQEQNFSEEEKNILNSTNVAFIRSGGHYELALKYCNPRIIFPEHYFPRSFIEEQVEESEKQNFEQPNLEVDKMIKASEYTLKQIESYETIISKVDINAKYIFRFLKLHPQVKYIK